MAKYKFTILMEQSTTPEGTGTTQRLAGWSESMYFEGDVLSPNAQGRIVSTRARLMPRSGRIIGQRLQQVFPVGASQVFGRVYEGQSSYAADQPQNALLCYGRNAARPNVRRFTLRGVPDDAITGGEFNQLPKFVRDSGEYFAALINLNMGFAARDLSIRPSAVVAIDATGLVTMAAAFAVEAGDRVQVQRGIDPYGTEFSFKAKVQQVVNATNFRLVNYRGPVLQGGSCLNITPKLILPFSDITINRSVVRKVGRPFAGYRGRSSKRSK